MTAWIVLQLADSAFPTGGFAHSSGLEAMVQAGEVDDAAGLEAFVVDSVHQTARGALPLVSATHDDPDRLAEVDAFAGTITWSHVAARASRNQGRALLDTAARAFGHAALIHARDCLGREPVSGAPLLGHLAPAFGFVTRTLDVSRDDAIATYLHLAIRGVLSSAVRLGVLGPTEAQALHHRLHPTLETACARARAYTLDDVAQSAPLIELFQATQDRLYSRLFQS
jgi:urease accessory protein